MQLCWARSVGSCSSATINPEVGRIQGARLHLGKDTARGSAVIRRRCEKNQKWVVVISLDYAGPVRAFGRGLSLGRYHRKLSEQHLQTTIQPIPVLLEMAEASSSSYYSSCEI
jgi:hypothetical protein